MGVGAGVRLPGRPELIGGGPQPSTRTVFLPARSPVTRMGVLLLELENAMGDNMLEKWWRTAPVLYGPKWRLETSEVWGEVKCVCVVSMMGGWVPCACKCVCVYGGR